jgi:hypothetical protein
MIHKFFKNVCRVMKSRRMKWVEYQSWIGEMRKSFGGKYEGNRQLGAPRQTLHHSIEVYLNK